MPGREAGTRRAENHAAEEWVAGIFVNQGELVSAMQVVKHDERFALMMCFEPMQDFSSPFAVGPFGHAPPRLALVEVLGDKLEPSALQDQRHLFACEVLAPGAPDHIPHAP